MNSGLLSLGDDCLLNVLRQLSPLPDLFNLSRTCTTLAKLVSDRRRWLVVDPRPPPVGAPSKGHFLTLVEALDASRPGDTIWLSPNSNHEICSVIVRWPVHLRGGGLEPKETTLLCPKGENCGLDFRATCLIANLSISSTVSPCIMHRAGHLRVDHCSLNCESSGLDHLCSPIVTEASSLKNIHQVGGKLIVSQSQLSGGGQGVRCRGTGTLQGVRAIYGSGRNPILFFEVDSRFPGYPVGNLGSREGSSRNSIARALTNVDTQRMMEAAASLKAQPARSPVSDNSEGCLEVDVELTGKGSGSHVRQQN